MAKTFFRSRGLSLPEKWEQPNGQYSEAFKIDERQTAPNSPLTLFREQSLNKYHTEATRTIARGFEDFIDGISGAICDAIDKWLRMASITSALINGPVGALTPGGMVGPPLMPFILASAPKETPALMRYSVAIANAVGNQWQMWQTGVAGTLTFPALAAFPGPMAPPSPNVPVPLVALPSAGESAMSPAMLKSSMQNCLADPDAQHAEALFDALAKALGNVFQTFKASTIVQNVLGMGPVPTFAPPVVLVGPVLGGTVIPKPGVLM